MKKISALLMSLVLVCGCAVKAEYGMNIKSDKSMDFSVVAAFDDELISALTSMSSSSENVSEEETWSLIEEQVTSGKELKDFRVEKYQEKGYKGFKITKTISNIDDLTGEKAEFNVEDYQNIDSAILFTKNGDNYKANITLSNSSADTDDSSEQSIDYDVKFYVTLPSKAISHNATTVENGGKKLVWDLANEKTKNIEFEFSTKADSSLLPIIIGGCAIVVIGCVAFVVLNKKKPETNM